MNDLRARVDDLTKKVRGIDALEARVAKLEKELAALKKAKAPARRSTTRKPPPSLDRNPASRSGVEGGVSRALAFLLVTSAVVAAAPVVAKEGVVARLVTPIPREAEPGSIITVVWTLASVDDGKRRPFRRRRRLRQVVRAARFALPEGRTRASWAEVDIVRESSFPVRGSAAS